MAAAKITASSSGRLVGKRKGCPIKKTTNAPYPKKLAAPAHSRVTVRFSLEERVSGRPILRVMTREVKAKRATITSIMPPVVAWFGRKRQNSTATIAVASISIRMIVVFRSFGVAIFNLFFGLGEVS